VLTGRGDRKGLDGIWRVELSIALAAHVEILQASTFVRYDLLKVINWKMSKLKIGEKKLFCLGNNYT